MKSRKLEEQQYHNLIRSDELKKNDELYKYYTSNTKYYSIDRGNRNFVFDWLKKNCKGKKVLDYCCGYGQYTFACADYGADAYGIDISDVTIKICNKSSAEREDQGNTHFYVMDAENLEFENDFFDVILCMGVLHHLDINKAFRELSRVIKPSGTIICTEALGHNPFIQIYRRLTPHLRTAYETDHIIKMSHLKLASSYFKKIDTNFFHLATLVAVPFRNVKYFEKILSILERIDRLILKIPFINKQAWMIVFQLSDPQKKDS